MEELQKLKSMIEDLHRLTLLSNIDLILYIDLNLNLDFQVYRSDPRARSVPLQRLQRPEEAVDGCENINIQHYNVQIHCDVRISILNISVPNQAVFSININITCNFFL